MDGFYRIPSALKILLIELVAVFFFPITLAGVITEIKPGIFPDYNNLDGFGDWSMALVGPLFFVWVLYDIFRPRVKDEAWGIFFKVKFRFCSTHPSYVLIDAITVGFAFLFLWAGTTAKLELATFRLVLATALFFPAVRLFSWYGLGKKINSAETFDAHQPALWAFGIFASIIGAAALGTALL